MDAQAVLEQADKLGIQLWVEGNRIRYRPKSAAPVGFVDALRQHKGEVMEYLRQQGGGIAPLETCRLLAWASELAEQDLVLPERITYVEAPLRRVTTQRVSWYATHYLRTIISARIGQETEGWGMYDRHWHRKCEEEALSALAALRQVMEARQKGGDE